VILAEIADESVQELPFDAATVAMATGPQTWTPAYATSPRAERLQQYAFDVGEGPCFDVLRDHAPVLVPDLRAAGAMARWPAWSGKAGGLGVCSVAAFPIQAGAIASGVLTMYSASPRLLNHEQMRVALRLADKALLALLDLIAGLSDTRPLDKDLSAILRADVHRAAGMVMVQADLPIDHALARLRAHAFASGRPLSEIADDVLARRLRFTSDPAAE
jgi:hypothetical protein